MITQARYEPRLKPITLPKMNDNLLLFAHRVCVDVQERAWGDTSTPVYYICAIDSVDELHQLTAYIDSHLDSSTVRQYNFKIIITTRMNVYEYRKKMTSVVLRNKFQHFNVSTQQFNKFGVDMRQYSIGAIYYKTDRLLNINECNRSWRRSECYGDIKEDMKLLAPRMLSPGSLIILTITSVPTDNIETWVMQNLINCYGYQAEVVKNVDIAPTPTGSFKYTFYLRMLNKTNGYNGRKIITPM